MVPKIAFPDTHALIQELSRRLCNTPTATATLFAWCEEHRLSSGPVTVICRCRCQAPAVARDVLTELKPLPREPVAYRSVQLVRGGLPLVDAENWFIPHRLSPDMRDALEATDIPFGDLIAPLSPMRRTLSVRAREFPVEIPVSHLLETQRVEQQHPEAILRIDAVVISGSGLPLAYVRENFRPELIGNVSSSCADQTR
jgi:chorismate-pyruvate lyase